MLKYIFYMLYIILLFTIVWVLPGKSNPDTMMNFVPFDTIQLYIQAFIYGYASVPIIIGNLLGNILLFTPLGIILFTYLRHTGIFILLFLSIYIPSYIEKVQLLLHIGGYGTRSVDIDDVLLNMVGIWLGYFIKSHSFWTKFTRDI